MLPVLQVRPEVLQCKFNFTNKNHSKFSVYFNEAHTGGESWEERWRGFVSFIKGLEMNKIIETWNNFKISDVFVSIEYGLIILLDFCLRGHSIVLLIMLAWIALISKFTYILTKMLSHEKSKKLIFYFYIAAMSAILGQCAILITSREFYAPDEGILLAYIYATAILMLFLIYLALTTCESYLYKQKKKGMLEYRMGIFKIFINVFVFLFVIVYYNDLIVEVVDTYYTKLAIFVGWEPDPKDYDIQKMLIKPISFNHPELLFGSDVKEKKWSIFDMLKFDVIDSYTNYMLSAVLQMCALVIVILALVM